MKRALSLLFFFRLFLTGVCCSAQPACSFESVNVITGEYIERFDDSCRFGNVAFDLSRAYAPSPLGPSGWTFRHPLFDSEREAAGSGSVSSAGPTYRFDREGSLAEVVLENGKTLCLTPLGTSGNLEISLPGGRFVQYFTQTVSSRLGPSRYVDQVKYSNGFWTQYTYSPHPNQNRLWLVKKEEPNGRFLILDRYVAGRHKVGEEEIQIVDTHRDPRIGRVRSQSRPLGLSGSPVVSAQFIYRDGYTLCLDALGYKKVYRYAGDRITQIEEYDKTGNLYRTKRFFWEGIRLISRSVEDAFGVVARCETYRYDRWGNLIQQTLWGNLSGQCTLPVVLDPGGMPIPNGVEKFSTSTRYDAKTHSLPVFRKDDSGKGVIFEYAEESLPPKAKFVCFSDQIQTREFYTYNKKGQLIETQIDDGTSRERGQMEGVTELRGTSFRYNETGEVEEEEKWACDLATGNRVVSETTFFTYSGDKLSQKQVLDASGTCILEEIYKWDSFGNLVEKSGNEPFVREYDCFGNLLQEIQGASSLVHEYDFAHRKIATESEEGKVSYRYDYLGNLIAEVDPFGNETLRSYDPFGREVEVTDPPVIGPYGEEVRYTERYAYNVLDQKVEGINRLGEVTHTQCTVRGDPAQIFYADGSSERFIYSFNGELIEQKLRTGERATYVRDSFGRVLQEEVYAPDGTLLTLNTYRYTPFHAIEKVDIHRKKETYTYDMFGRKIAECLFDRNDLIQGTAFEYGLNGRLTNLKTWNGTRWVAGPEETDHTEDIQKEEEVHFSEVINSLGQRVCQKSVVDSKGFLTLYTHDALSRVVSREAISPLGEKIEKLDIVYDPLGRKSKEVYCDMRGRCQVQTYAYDSHGNLTSWGDGDRTYRYGYNAQGRVVSVQKPGGVVISLGYDVIGQLTHLFTSDGSVDYVYVYGDRGECIRAVDRSRGEETKREYVDGFVAEEIFSNGLKVSYERNHMGQVTRYTLPDHSFVTYEYDEQGALSKICRRGHEMQVVGRDRMGNVTERSLLGDLGTLSIARDSLGRIEKIETPFWSERIERDNGNGLYVFGEDGLGSFSSHYTFDEKGQLISEKGEWERAFIYDGLQNRLGQSEVSPCDPSGHVVSWKEYRLTYDGLGRLTCVELPSGGFLSFDYDPFHRRTCRKEVSERGELRSCVKYFYQDGCEVGSVSGGGELLDFRVIGETPLGEIASGVLFEIDGTLYQPIHDFRGNVASLVDMDGRVQATYRYSGFGEKRHVGMQAPWAFASKREEAGGAFVYFGARYYIPESGRWTTPDPMGTPDGVNRYAYVQNDPIRRVDPTGLYSLFDIPKTYFRKGLSAVSRLKSWLGGVQDWLNPLKELQFVMTPTLDEFFGARNLTLFGFHLDTIDIGVFGNGEVSDRVRISWVNGLFNTRGDCRRSLGLISRLHGGVNVHFLLDPSSGWTQDLLRGVLGKLGFPSLQSRLLARHWQDMIRQMGGVRGGGKVVHYAHSLGAVQTQFALDLLSKEEKRMIEVFTFGTPSFIYDNDLGTVVNFVSRRDGVPLLDPVNYFRSLGKESEGIVFLDSWVGVPLIDHFFLFPTYMRQLARLGTSFRNKHWHGSVVL